MSADSIKAWSVHLYTALGAPIALGALVATFAGDARATFLLLAAALFIDSTDGTLARRYRVKEVVPTFDGARLDDIVDYITYALVPMVFAVRFGVLPETGGVWIAALPLLASAYGFCRTDAKTGDFYFTGFPSYWNVVVFYLYTLGIAPGPSAFVIVVLSVLVFVPIRYHYTSRNRFLQKPTIAFGAVWAASLLWALVQMPDAPRELLWASLAFPAWYVGLSLYCNVRPPEVRAAPE